MGVFFDRAAPVFNEWRGLGFHVVQAGACLCARISSALYLALPQR
jgi:hypothetical protein